MYSRTWLHHPGHLSTMASGALGRGERPVCSLAAGQLVYSGTWFHPGAQVGHGHRPTFRVCVCVCVCVCAHASVCVCWAKGRHRCERMHPQCSAVESFFTTVSISPLSHLSPSPGSTSTPAERPARECSKRLAGHGGAAGATAQRGDQRDVSEARASYVMER